MTVRRVMGIETEYGISVPGDPTANPMLLSGQVVNAYATPQGIRADQASWDYADEAPLRDARGLRDGPRQYADASQLTDEEDPTLANVVLTNGARLYVDHAHPEYCSPEVTSPRAAVDLGPGRRADHARVGAPPRRRLPAAGGQPLQEQHRRQGRVLRHPRELPDARARRRSPTSCATSIPFFVARQVICGAGRVGIGVRTRSTAGFQIAPAQPTSSRSRSGSRRRSSARSSTPATSRTPWPTSTAGCTSSSATPTSCDVANLLKLGTTSLVLAMIEDRAI